MVSATVRVEKATSELLSGPDWTLNMDICDAVNSDHSLVKDMVKATKKRLQHKNPKVQFLALTLLETIIKNCGDHVHREVVERDALQEMVKIVKKKNDIEVRNKILVLLESWQEAFGGAGGKYPQYYTAYIELKRSGVQFPQRSADSGLIFTPPITHPAPIHRSPQAAHGMPSNASLRLEEAMASEMANLRIQDIDGIQSVLELLSDMLNTVNPNDSEAVKDEVITELVNQCRSNQSSLVHFLSTTSDEELLGQGLALNDNLQTVLAKHDAIASGSPLPPIMTLGNFGRRNSPAASAPLETKQLEYEALNDNDYLVQIPHRKSLSSPTSTQSTSAESGVHPVSSNCSGLTAESSTSEASSSIASNALSLLDSPTPVKTATDEQDLIDLWSITLSSGSTLPQTPPVASPSTSNQNGPQVCTPAYGHWYSYQPSPYIPNQGYNSYNSYVAPWARPQPQPEVPKAPSSYPLPPWEMPDSTRETPASAEVNSFYSTDPYAASNGNISAVPAPTYMPMPMPMYASSPQQQYDSLDEGHVNVSLRQPAPEATKAFVFPNNVFDDLIDLRIPDGNQKSSTGQGTSGGRE